MKKVIIPAILVLGVSGCSWIGKTSLADLILDDVLGCDGDRTGMTAWYCTVDYARDDRHDLLQDPSDHNPRERNVEQDKPSPEVDKDKHGRHGRRGKRGRRGRHGHHGGHHGHHGGHHGHHGHGED